MDKNMCQAQLTCDAFTADKKSESAQHRIIFQEKVLIRRRISQAEVTNTTSGKKTKNTCGKVGYKSGKQKSRKAET